MRYYLILVDAELERHPVLGHSILDSYLHREAMDVLPDSSRRGRPDIVHNFLSLCQSSLPNIKGMIKVFIHTRDDLTISIDADAAIPPNYIHFLEVMSTLYRMGKTPGMVLRHNTLQGLLQELRPDYVVCLSPHGEKVHLEEVFRERKEESIAVLIGGFPEGDYVSPVYKLADLAVSLGDELLTVWSVTSEVLCALPR